VGRTLLSDALDVDFDFAYVGRTLLSDAFDVDFAFDSDVDFASDSDPDSDPDFDLGKTSEAAEKLEICVRYAFRHTASAASSIAPLGAAGRKPSFSAAAEVVPFS
jgi:hypothetical protein